MILLTNELLLGLHCSGVFTLSLYRNFTVHLCTFNLNSMEHTVALCSTDIFLLLFC